MEETALGRPLRRGPCCAVGTSLLVPEADGVSGRPCVVFIEALAAGSSG
ncbi:hypothetical protein ACXKGW_29435 [Klebsiella pneumoniae subsp. pneumoniae]